MKKTSIVRFRKVVSLALCLVASFLIGVLGWNLKGINWVGVYIPLFPSREGGDVLYVEAGRGAHSVGLAPGQTIDGTRNVGWYIHPCVSDVGWFPVEIELYSNVRLVMPALLNVALILISAKFLWPRGVKVESGNRRPEGWA